MEKPGNFLPIYDNFHAKTGLMINHAATAPFIIPRL